jgi:hypothetical protein
MRELLTVIASLRAQISRSLERIPAWPDIVRLAEMVCAPLVRFAHTVLRAMPALRRVEWLLEIESLTRRHPVALALSMLYVIWRGLKTTPLGHIGTDPIIYPLLGAISGFNPFLGLVCGALFGAADLVQKLIWPDIYGARGWTDLNYWGAMGGYVVAYSSVMIMGVFPGMLSRVFRTLIRLAIRSVLFRRAAASADGATPQDDGVYPLAEMLAGAAGGFLGGYYVMNSVAPHTESPAFDWRPKPDNSCHHLETYTHLKGRAGIGGEGSALGGLSPTVAPASLVDRGPYVPFPPAPQPADPSLLEPPHTPPVARFQPTPPAPPIPEIATPSSYSPAPPIESNPDPAAQQRPRDPVWLQATKLTNDAVQTAQLGFPASQRPFGDASDLLGVGATFADQYFNSTAMTSVGKGADAISAAEMNAVLGAEMPVTALVDGLINTVGDVATSLGYDDAGDAVSSFSVGKHLSSAGRAIVTLEEGLIEGDSSGMMAFQQDSLDGRNGLLFQWAARGGQTLADNQAMQYWLENGALEAARAESQVATGAKAAAAVLLGLQEGGLK